MASPAVVSEQCRRTLTFSRQSIAEFARLTGDANPVHVDADAAAQAHHGRIIASGQQSTSQMIGLIATHFSRRCEHFAREVLCLNFNFAFKAPVFADEPIDVLWTVSAVDWHARLGGWLVLVDGRATSLDRPCVVGRGTLLLKAREVQR
jgi:acyl dehydratase